MQGSRRNIGSEEGGPVSSTILRGILTRSRCVTLMQQERADLDDLEQEFELSVEEDPIL
jgi:hypothetical protein